MEFEIISKEQYDALVHLSKKDVKFRKVATNLISELEHSKSFPDKYKYLLICILKLLNVELMLVVETPEPIVFIRSDEVIVWNIIKEYMSLVKIEVEGTTVNPGDKIGVTNHYIDHIKSTTKSTEAKTIILVALINTFSEKKIEANGSFDFTNCYIHKKLNILLNSIVLYNKQK